MVLSEALGLWLPSIVRKGIGWLRRLAFFQEPDGHRLEMVPRDLWFQIIGVETYLLLPDASMIDSDIFIFEKRTKLVIADSSERKKWRAIGLRRLMRESKLTQAPVSNVLRGKPVRHRTLSIIRQAADRLVTKS
jgi:hypothetical protein